MSSYTQGSGTSQAAPLTAGLAALVIAENPTLKAHEVKSCIIRSSVLGGRLVSGHAWGADDIPAPVGELDFWALHAPGALRCAGGLVLPAEVDVVFAVDTSASMAGEIERLREEVKEIAFDLSEASIAANDVRFGLVSFEDYPGIFDPDECGLMPDVLAREAIRYGGPSDSAFRVGLRMTSDLEALEAAVGGLNTGAGRGDKAEAYARVIWELGPGDGRISVGARDDALTVVIMLGDSVPHSVDLNLDAAGEARLPPFFPLEESHTGIDPGPDGEIDCFLRDDDPYADLSMDYAISSLASHGHRLLFLDSSDLENIDYWRYWAQQAGGSAVSIEPDGSIPRGVDLAETILGLLEESQTRQLEP